MKKLMKNVDLYCLEGRNKGKEEEFFYQIVGIYSQPITSESLRITTRIMIIWLWVVIRGRLKLC